MTKIVFDTSEGYPNSNGHGADVVSEAQAISINDYVLMNNDYWFHLTPKSDSI